MIDENGAQDVGRRDEIVKLGAGVEDVEQLAREMAGEGMTLAGIRRILALEAEVAVLQHQLAVERARR